MGHGCYIALDSDIALDNYPGPPETNSQFAPEKMAGPQNERIFSQP